MNADAAARIRDAEAAQPDGRTSTGVYLPYWRACGHDIPPIESIRTPWLRGRVTQAVD